jgi:hypothetical protein
VANLMGAFNTAVEVEASLVDASKNSEYTEKLAVADRRRDQAVIGMSQTVDAALRYFDPTVVNAAKRISLRLKDFRTLIEDKPYEEESAAVKILVLDLKSRFAADVDILKIGGWVDELSYAETDFDELFAKRNTEWAGRPQGKLVDARKQVDVYYREMVTLIDAYGALNGYDITGEFVRELNLDIKYFNDHIYHSGRKDLDAATIEDIPDQIYAGEPLFPMPVVSYEGEKLLFTVDYEVSYHDNNRPGTAKITVHGKGKYKGIKEVSFNITGMVNN